MAKCGSTRRDEWPHSTSARERPSVVPTGGTSGLTAPVAKCGSNRWDEWPHSTSARERPSVVPTGGTNGRTAPVLDHYRTERRLKSRTIKTL